MSFHLPNIFRRENQTLENFYRYSFLFFSFLFLYISISIKTVYLPYSRMYENTIFHPKGLEVLMWFTILMFIDSFAAGVMYKRHEFYGIWRYRNAVVGFYLVTILILCSLFILNNVAG